MRTVRLILSALVATAFTACGPTTSGTGDDDDGGSDGAPLPGTCTPGAGGCDGVVHYECAADGRTHLDPVTCPQACDPLLGCVTCVPGSRQCDGTVSMVCNAEGTGLGFGRDCADWNVGCSSDGFCADLWETRTYANPNLKPERARSAELALRHDGGALQGGVVLFASRVSDLIAVDPSFTTVINVNRARIRGITLDASWRSDIWTARGEFTHQDAEDADTGARLVRRARQYGSASLGVVQGPWRGGIEWVVSGDRFGAASNSAASRMGGYGLVNLNASWAMTPRWTLAARLNNLTGRRYELVQGYNTPGSNLFVSLAWADL